MSARPIEHCYWVMPGVFLAGEYPRDKAEDRAQQKVEALTDGGVAAFVDLTEAGELLPYEGLLPPEAVYQRFPIRDVSVPGSSGETLAILDAIDAHIHAGRIVYVHCWGGVGRTGVIVGCWLARHGYPGQAALDRLHERWRQCPKSRERKSPETFQQENYIMNWEEC